jgi:hypothetical protein
MSTKPSFSIAVAQAAVHRHNAGPMSLRTKTMIAISVVVLALLYAKGVTLMIDPADTPSAYATFLNRAD